MRLLRDGKSGVVCAVRGALLLAFLVFSISSWSQQPETVTPANSASITGKVTTVTGENTTNSLSGIPIKLTSTTPGAISQTKVSDLTGHFEFTRLPAGSYTLEAAVEGFKPWNDTVTVGPKEIATEDVTLQINSLLEQVEVLGVATEIATQSVSATATVNEQQLENLPLRTGKFTEALSIAPGVIRTQEGKLNFNGQAESQGMLLVDLAENVDPVSGSFAIPVPVDAIQSMQVFNTPDSAAYGGFSGGLTRIEIVPPVPEWNYKFMDIVPSFGPRTTTLIGLLNMTPRVEFGGPLIKNKLNFSEHMDSTNFGRIRVHADFPWPFNETVTYDLVSFHGISIHVFAQASAKRQREPGSFHRRSLYANINTLIPQNGFQRIFGGAEFPVGNIRLLPVRLRVRPWPRSFATRIFIRVNKAKVRPP